MTLFLRGTITKLCLSVVKFYFQGRAGVENSDISVHVLIPSLYGGGQKKGKEIIRDELSAPPSSMTSVSPNGGRLHWIHDLFARTAKKEHKCYKPSDDLLKKSHLPRLFHFCPAFTGNTHSCE